MLEVKHVAQGDNLQIIPRERRPITKAALGFMLSIEDGTAIVPTARQQLEDDYAKYREPK